MVVLADAVLAAGGLPNRGRVEWAIAVRQFLSRPQTGMGPGNFKRNIVKHQFAD